MTQPTTARPRKPKAPNRPRHVQVADLFGTIHVFDIQALAETLVDRNRFLALALADSIFRANGELVASKHGPHRGPQLTAEAGT